MSLMTTKTKIYALTSVKHTLFVKVTQTHTHTHTQNVFVLVAAMSHFARNAKSILMRKVSYEH